MNEGNPIAHDESGFTLVEILVVILIFGLLAAVVIPSFLGQRDKARDADAKVRVRTAQTAIETYATEHDGEYADANADELQKVEGALERVPDSDLTVEPSGAERYEISVRSATGNVFSITRVVGGTTSYNCTDEETAGCPSGGNWVD